jgi:hypothetical protein
LEPGIWSFSYLPSVIELGKPFSQLLGEFQGLADMFSDSVLAQPPKPTIAKTSKSNNTQWASGFSAGSGAFCPRRSVLDPRSFSVLFMTPDARE